MILHIEAATIAKLELRPGDELVLWVPEHFEAEACARIQEKLERRFPGHRCHVLADSMTLQILRPGAHTPIIVGG